MKEGGNQYRVRQENMAIKRGIAVFLDKKISSKWAPVLTSNFYGIALMIEVCSFYVYIIEHVI